MAPVVGFFAGAFGWAAAGSTMAGVSAGIAFGQTIIGTLAVKLLTQVAVGALMSALAPSPSGGGIQIETTLRGEDNPETIILGKYASSGQCVYVNSHGKSNKYVTHVVEICSAPGATLRRLMLDDEWCEIGTTAHADYGYPITYEDRTGYAYIRYYDGSQTAADPMLVAKYAADPDIPWAATAVGYGLCYAVFTFVQDRERMPQVPPYRFEVDGIPLYDIRKDSTRGGSGPQRLNNPSTWAQTDNPIVMAWNIKRGIPLPGGQIWGGGFALDAMPRAAWVAAMNACDAPKASSSGGTRPAYRAGIEAALTQEPAITLTELYKAASATVADMGYGWNIVVGAPSLPVYTFTDRDAIISKSQTLDPFPGLSDTYNAVSARYPDPGHKWETKEAPLRTNATWEAADAFGRRTAAITLPAVPYPGQVQQLQREWINDERRFRRHVINLPPDSAAVEIGDCVAWTSLLNGYDSKVFTVYEIAEDLRTGIRQFSLKERDPSDYDWSASDELPSVPGPTKTPRAPAIVPGFGAEGVSIQDASGRNRRAAIALSWDDDIEARGIRWQIRLAGRTTVALRGDTQDLDDGGHIVKSGVLPATAYEVRAKLNLKRATDWTPWKSLVTPAVYIKDVDVSDEFIDQIQQIADLAGVTTVSALPTSGNKPNQIVCLTPPGRLYRWTGSTWTQNLYAGVEPGSLDVAAFAASIQPIETFLTALPTSGNFNGRLAYVRSTGRLHKHNGTAWIDTNAADQIVGKLIAAQIAAGAIGAEQLAAGAIAAGSMAIMDLANLVTDPMGIDLSHWAKGPSANPELWTSASTGDRINSALAIRTVAGNYAEVINRPGGAYAAPNRGNGFAVIPGETYHVRATLHKAVGGATAISAYLGLRVTNGSTTDSSYPRLIATWTSAESGWRELSGIITIPATVGGLPAAAAFVHMGLGNTATLSGVRVLFGGMQIRRANAGELTVDGSIIADHLSAGEVITKSAQIRAAIVNTAHIVDLSVNTAKIGAQAVSADWNTYTAGWITLIGSQAGSINSLTMSDSTVNGCPAWITFSAQVLLTRSVSGKASGTIVISLNETAVAEFFVEQYVTAGMDVRIPISVTRRIVLPSSGPHQISVAGVSNGATGVNDNQFALRYRRLEVNVFKR